MKRRLTPINRAPDTAFLIEECLKEVAAREIVWSGDSLCGPPGAFMFGRSSAELGFDR